MEVGKNIPALTHQRGLGRDSRWTGRCWTRLVVQVAAEGEGGDAVACPGEHALMAVAGCQ
jgi:hypothetical protein